MPLRFNLIFKLMYCRSFLIIFFLGLLSACSTFLFYPQKEWRVDAKIENYQYQIINIAMPDGILLNAWLMPHRQVKRKGAVIFFHGNAENISINARQVFWLTDYGYDVLLVDYRGYGHSQGNVNLDDTINDIAVAAGWFSAQYDADTPRYVIAHSLGATMTGYVMATHSHLREGFNAIVLDAGFAEYRRMMRDAMDKNWLMALFKYPAALGMPDKYDLLDVIQDISPTPLMIVHGKSDPVVPYQHGIDLYAKALSPKVFISHDRFHNDAFDVIEQRKLLLEFFERYSDSNVIDRSTTQ